MDKKEIDRTMEQYVADEEMAGGALYVRQGGELAYRGKWGYAKKESSQPIAYDSIYRMMSMTKCVTAAAVMMCVERGLIDLDAPLSSYIPEFSGLSVVADERYVYDETKLKKLPVLLLGFSMKKVKREPAKREITIRDLLSHSSGLEQGLVGLLALLKGRKQYDTLEKFVKHYRDYALDFQPGTGTGYSPIAGFDILGYLVSVVSGMSLEAFLQKEICGPLGMKDTTFFLNQEQKERLVDVYKKEKDVLVNVTGTKEDMAGALHQKEVLFEHGCGGLYSTVEDYEHFGEMLLGGGNYRGKQLLKPETVELMHTEAPKAHLEPEPGMVWGLGMKIRQDPKSAGSSATKGTYGWSGAFGTHFFVSPTDQLEAVFVMNRSDIGGSGSYISKKVEELVFGIWGGKKEHETEV